MISNAPFSPSHHTVMANRTYRPARSPTGTSNKPPTFTREQQVSQEPARGGRRRPPEKKQRETSRIYLNRSFIRLNLTKFVKLLHPCLRLNEPLYNFAFPDSYILSNSPISLPLQPWSTPPPGIVCPSTDICVMRGGWLIAGCCGYGKLTYLHQYLPVRMVSRRALEQSS
ncbi:hypothetical protein B9Z19DRAFT_1078014 [Tuber borchii]|uniref:Uncharacterized protein n=1 Tax=Tuber borchii TaxID=42251 RepID=A0A2T6ZZV9_TUBBO|nr:hypothetical protein B9Z19DRAFT_1078014 [Tuber borchii]